MHSFLESSNKLLRKRGYRLTPQRHIILRVIEEANEHLSVEQITERVQQYNPHVSLSTVYRTLELLRELGLVRENHLPGEQPHYEAAEGAAHHHLVCRSCGKVRDLKADFPALTVPSGATQGYKVLSAEVIFRGECDECRKNQPQ